MNAVATVPDVVVRQIPVDQVQVGSNVRVDPGELEGLAASIRDLGVLQPVKAVLQADGTYRLVWGQRRLLASRMAGLATIPAILVAAADVDAPGSPRAIEQLVENLDRRDLNPIEEAHALREVLDADAQLTQAALAERLGRSPSWLANSLRLLGLDETVQEKVRAGEISASHGKAIASLPDQQQRELAQRAVSSKLSAHQLEREIEWKQQEAKNAEAKAAKTAKWIPKAIAALEAAGVAKDVDVAVQGSAYDTDLNAIAAAIKAAGWKKVNGNGSYGTRPEGCDCKAVKLDVGGRKAEVAPRCIDRRHVDRQVNNDHLARKAAADQQDREAAAARGAIRAALAANPPARAILCLLVRSRDGWGARPWAEYMARDESDLIDELATDLTETQALFWPDTNAVPVAELLASLSGSPSPVVEGTEEPDAGVDAPLCSCGKPKVQAGGDRWVCTNPDHKAGKA